MRRVGHLFDALTDCRTLTVAAWRAARGKRRRPEVRDFLARIDPQIGGLSRELRAQTFCFGVYRRFRIKDPKTRMIHAPPFRDRVAHHAIVAVAAPAFERGTIAHSYACRPGRGHHAALRRAREWMRPQDWFLKIDIRRYYDSVDHALLRQRLDRRFRERRLLALFDRLLDSYAATPGRGLPIGALTSQYLGNFFLDSLDHWVNQQLELHRYLRYMDDLLVFGDQGRLREVQDAIVDRLAQSGLATNLAVLNRCTEGVPFLGFVLYPDRVRLNREGRRRLRRRLGETEHAWRCGSISERELQARSDALFAHARFADDVAWRRVVVAFSRYGEVQEPEPGAPGRFVEQHREELPLRHPQQEQAVQSQQEQRLPCLSGSQYDGSGGDWPQSQPADNAPSRARRRLRRRRDETKGKSPASAEIQLELDWRGPEKGDAGAPLGGKEEDEA